MKLTKFEHACFTVEKDGQILVVDPGDFTTDFVVPTGVVGVVITHEHGDHFDKDKLQAIVDQNPDATIVAHTSITSQLDGFKTLAATVNEGLRIGSFELEFYGGEHARITNDWQPIPNLGVMINSQIYYPGDSFTITGEAHVKILAIPASAPWMKIAEAINFLEAVRPDFAFPTHDAILSDIGKDSIDKWLELSAEKIGTEYQRLTEPLDI